MNVNIVGRKVTLKDNFKERVNKKLGKFERIFSEEANVTVTVTVEKNRQVVEVTIRDNGMLYRAESSASEMNDALDSVVDSLGGQIRKNKAKLSKRLRADSIDQYFAPVGETESEATEEEYKVVRTKRFPVKPQTIDEAILEMNLIGHQFYMFRNGDTNEINVVYRRNDGTYGLLEPDGE